MREDVAQTVMGAAVVDDILGLLVLSVVVGASGGGLDLPRLALLVGTAVAFIVAGVLVGVGFFRRIGGASQGGGRVPGSRVHPGLLHLPRPSGRPSRGTDGCGGAPSLRGGPDRPRDRDEGRRLGAPRALG